VTDSSVRRTAILWLWLVAGAPGPAAHLASAQEVTPAQPKLYFDEPTWVHERPPKLTGRVWHAKTAPPGAKVQPLRRVRVVDLGGNIVRRHEDAKTGQGAFSSHLGMATVSGVDVNGNGEKSEFIRYRQFSLDVPFCGRGAAYDIEAASTIFYGGATGYFPDERGKIEEFGINTSEGKNWTFITPDGAGAHCMYGVWLWKK